MHLSTKNTSRALTGIMLTTFFLVGTSQAALPAFPGAVGFGSTTVGGSGRHLSSPKTTIFKVNNLKDSGSGSLRACVEASMPRICTFETSGTIKLSSRLRVKSPYLTIAGQTAPKPGIIVRGSGLRVENHDVLVQHLEFRIGDDASGPKPDLRDGITIGGQGGQYARAAHNVVIDHVSVSWAIDENFSTWYPTTRNVTLSNSIIAEGLHNSRHSKGAHSKGAMIGVDTKNISLHHNLFGNNQDRNIYFEPGSSAEFVNNLIYNWGGTSGSNITNVSDHKKSGKPVLLFMAGNFYERGPNSSQEPPLYGSTMASKTRVYVRGNIGPSRPTTAAHEWSITNLPESYRTMSSPLTRSTLSDTSAAEAFSTILVKAGSRPKERNQVDARILKELLQGKGKIKDCVSGCQNHAGGWPSVAVVKRTLTSPSNPQGDDDKDGYTNLEEWLHKLSAEVE